MKSELLIEVNEDKEKLDFDHSSDITKEGHKKTG